MQISIWRRLELGGAPDEVIVYTWADDADWMFLPNWSARVEYLYYNLGRVNNGLTPLAFERRGLNLFTGAVIAVLVMLSVILTASVLFPDKMNETMILAILAGGSVLALIAAIASGALLKRRPFDNRGTKSLEPRDVADAAAFTTPSSSDVSSE